MRLHDMSRATKFKLLKTVARSRHLTSLFWRDAEMTTTEEFQKWTLKHTNSDCVLTSTYVGACSPICRTSHFYVEKSATVSRTPPTRDRYPNLWAQYLTIASRKHIIWFSEKFLRKWQIEIQILAASPPCATHSLPSSKKKSWLGLNRKRKKVVEH